MSQSWLQLLAQVHRCKVAAERLAIFDDSYLGTLGVEE